MKIAILLVVSIVLGCVAINTQAQNYRTKTFPLNVEFPATVAVCSNEQYAKDVAETGPEMFAFLMKMGACMGGQTMVKYTRHVYTSKDGKAHVYEVEIAGHKVFAITDWKHDSV